MAKSATINKRKYNNKVYAPLTVWLPKELVAEFKEACVEREVSQASVVKEAMEKFLGK